MQRSQLYGETMSESNGIKMRIIALDELMKSLAEVGRGLEDPKEKALLKKLYDAAKVRADFLKASRGSDSES
jgi:hypothetical protein